VGVAGKVSRRRARPAADSHGLGAAGSTAAPHPPPRLPQAMRRPPRSPARLAEATPGCRVGRRVRQWQGAPSEAGRAVSRMTLACLPQRHRDAHNCGVTRLRTRLRRRPQQRSQQQPRQRLGITDDVDTRCCCSALASGSAAVLNLLPVATLALPDRKRGRLLSEACSVPDQQNQARQLQCSEAAWHRLA
jgi:hypothetical protein